MLLRRSAAVLAAATALCTAAVPAASAAPGTAPAAHATADRPGGDELPDGLYGTADPKYDGVWRQSVALLALEAAGATPAPEAVDWLAGQQCEDGSFAAYRADPDAGCDAGKTPADTNATGAAVQALAAVGGRDDAVKKSVEWLRSAQNEDGGWGYNSGSPSDANSVSVVIGALSAAGQKPQDVRKDGKSPYEALESFQLGCDAEPGERGAFAYQPDKDGGLSPNDDASAAAALAGTGQGLLLEKPLDGNGGSEPVRPLDCGNGPKGDRSEQDRSRTESADAGASYLASVVKKNEGHLMSVMLGAEKEPDYGNTADTVLALAAGGHRSEADYTLAWLEKNLGTWDKSEKDPAAIGSVMLARHAVGQNPATGDGGTDLLRRLNATGPEPAEMPSGQQGEQPSDDTGAEEKSGDDSGNSVAMWSMIAAGLAAGAGIGFLLSGRRKKQDK
ncbi:prenyltransferase/squalene oxidase repeat-containing protein [Streptomyces sp. HNM0574]|uniref:prenyltransferase/squalene oxidase repeat-containing protein n=1 Tax=Streptomyces sp. HNM0574 TaxID=2714954 RepID=UPI00146C9A5B|nr:prenyltransferase/squalene oxidase repeat-containing protein [Streptomyces sp. HNM0574]NLU70113.1 terpene cyclase/mutase family protein [Streptomyces sp. HNM0574]